MEALQQRIACAQGTGVKVALVDSGVDARQVRGRLCTGVSIEADPAQGVLRTTPDIRDLTGHGTMCARIIFAAAPHAEVLPVRVFTDMNETSCDIVAAAIEWAVRRQADIINLSLGTLRPTDWPLLHEACVHAADSGAVLVAADARRSSGAAPAVFPEVIGVRVASTEARSGISIASDTPAECIVGVSYRSAVPDTLASSFAAAFVSGVVARILEASPGMSVAWIRQVLSQFDVPALHPSRVLPSVLVKREPQQRKTNAVNSIV